MALTETEKQKLFNTQSKQGERIAALEVEVKSIEKIDKRTCAMEKSMRHLWWRAGLATGVIVAALKIAFTYIPQG